MKINIFSPENFNDVEADIPVLREMIKECNEEMSEVVHRIVTGALRASDASFVINYLRNEKESLRRRLNAIMINNNKRDDYVK